MEKKSPIRRIWEMGKGEHSKLISAVLLAAAGVLCGMVPYFAAARIIVQLLAGERSPAAYVPWLAAALGGYLLRTLLYNGALAVSHRATFRILKTIRQLLLEKLPRLPLGTVMATSSGKLKQIAVFPIAFVFMMSVMGGYGKDYAGAVEATNEMSGTMIEYIHGIEVIKAFNQGKKSYARLVEKVRANAQYYYDWMRRSQLGMSMAYAFFPAQMLTVLPIGWLFYLHGTLSAGTFITDIILSLGMSAPIVAAFNFVDTLAQVGTTVGQVDEILKAQEQTHDAAPVSLPNHTIEVSHVSFSYHSGQEVLHDVNLRVPEKRMTALVGPSGSGKSTLAKLIAGFWDVENGTITMGGKDLKNIPLEQLYDQVAFVSQDNYLFDDTVRENIRMGRQNATDAEVEAAAEAAGCANFIRDLEKGYDTMVGGGGAHLSGGERQRISIARAMLKNAPIVILDEATANVDPENEERLQKAIEALTHEKTVLMIAHRLKTVRSADQILVMDAGRIVQRGKHAELIAQPGIYADFVNGKKESNGWRL